MTNFFVERQAVAIMLLPINNTIVTKVPHVQTLDTVPIESSFSMTPMSVISPTANDVCSLINNGILIPDFINHAVNTVPMKMLQ